MATKVVKEKHFRNMDYGDYSITTENLINGVKVSYPGGYTDFLKGYYIDDTDIKSHSFTLDKENHNENLQFFVLKLPLGSILLELNDGTDIVRQYDVLNVECGKHKIEVENQSTGCIIYLPGGDTYVAEGYNVTDVLEKEVSVARDSLNVVVQFNVALI